MTAPQREGQPPRSAGVLRRFAAMLYDALLVIALMMVVTAAFLPFTGGEALSAARSGALEYVYRGTLLCVWVSFFGLFWTRRGQTLGMAAWRLKLQTPRGSPPTWRQALLRLAGAVISLACLGLGYFWIRRDRDGLAWHDRWSGTRVVILPKRER